MDTPTQHTNQSNNDDAVELDANKDSILVNDKKVIYKDENGDFVFNLLNDLEYDGKKIKSLVIRTLKTAQDYRKGADMLQVYMTESKVTRIIDLNPALDSRLFDRLFRYAVKFNDEALPLSVINNISIHDYMILARLLNDAYLTFFR